ncbi:MAG: hypothetical protein MZW92_37240 [Comamonadaceae bacterium]|nr:hypothetical protein [Comamonadaceae bacterium]
MKKASLTTNASAAMTQYFSRVDEWRLSTLSEMQKRTLAASLQLRTQHLKSSGCASDRSDSPARKIADALDRLARFAPGTPSTGFGI